MTDTRKIRVVAAGVDAETMAQLAREAGDGRIDAVAVTDMQGARLVKKGQADYYLGTCWSGGGGALAAATALLGASRVGIAGAPGIAADPDKIAALLEEGKVAFGFPYEQSRSAIPLIISTILTRPADVSSEGSTRA
ncbi:DUF2620 family protein [Nocardioides sp.]|uniref:DUF2620 family protein n=1 Tax=Nocardioides sp. TaxID=35761 RepID=UPI0026171A12|nr:DUF2620 family protein [Nocardioides sp.]MCW2736850.1 yhfU [Nocardioides sp.]